MDLNADFSMTIDGMAVASASTLAVINPANGQAFAKAPDCSSDQLDVAVASAQRAFRAWRRVPIEERQALVAKAGARLIEHADEFARLFTRGQGRPVQGAGWRP